MTNGLRLCITFLCLVNILFGLGFINLDYQLTNMPPFSYGTISSGLVYITCLWLMGAITVNLIYYIKKHKL